MDQGLEPTPRISSLTAIGRQARRLAAFALFAFLMPAPGWAQVRATLNGEVRTDRGIVVRDAMVRLETDAGELVEQRPVTTAGQFFFLNVPKGHYILIVNAEGFETYREPLDLAEGPDTYDITISLAASNKMAAPKAEPPALSDAQAPKDARREYERAQKAIQSRKYGQAQKNLEAAVEQYACYARAQTKLGMVLSQQKDYKDAETAFRKSISCDPGYLDAYLELGQLLNAEKRYDEAVPVLEQGARQAPAFWQFYYEAGTAQYGLKHYDAAEQQFGKAKSMTTDPPPEISAKLADVYLRENAFQKAYASMQDYLKADPAGRFAPRIKDIMRQMESSGVLQSRQNKTPAASEQP